MSLRMTLVLLMLIFAANWWLGLWLVSVLAIVAGIVALIFDAAYEEVSSSIPRRDP